MRRLNVLILISTMLITSYISIVPDKVIAGEGYAKVYIICLPDVGGWTFPDRPYEPTKTKEGAIDALTFRESDCIPWVHPIQGNSPPFYGVTYYVVQSWSLYKSIIESYIGVIVVNTHGEIIPVPSGYSREGWVDKIAEAMLKRRITWVHTAGYPFYYAWYQGASNMELWGEDGFKRLMSHINLNDVTCPTDDELIHIDMNNAAKYNLLAAGWNDLSNARRVQRGRPLKASDFQNYTILPIWGSEDSYMTGAVIAFVKPSERVLPKDCRGFGAYVHIGTNATFTSGDSPTNGDYWRGYVGAAAAIWTETLVCKSAEVTKEYIVTDQWTGELIDYAYYGLTVVPVVTAYSYMNGKYYVHVDFFILGSMKTNFSRTIEKINFYLGYLPDDCRVKVDSYESKNGYKYDKPTIGIDWGAAAKWGLKAFIFFAGFYASGGAALVLKGIGGAMLFSEFLSLNPTITDVTNGVDELEPPNDYVDFEFDPPENYEVGESYTYGEFESIIRVKLEVNMTNRSQWTVIPMQWRVTMMDSGGQSIIAEGDVSLAAFESINYKSYYRATVFFEDFSKGVNKWRIGDMNPSAGYDYWGITKPPGGGPGSQAYCAAKGDNSIYGKPNDEISCYDKDMNAYMSMQVDFRPYRTVTLRYYLFYSIASGDYLAVEYYQDGSWYTAETLSGSNTVDYWEETSIPTTAEKIRFRFYSNGDGNVGWGVFINCIEIVAELPNDANTNADAGDSFDSATYVTHPNSYGGYLNYDEDWYKFYISSQDITEEKQIYISVSTPQYTYFKLELYYPNGTCAKSSAGTLTYTLSASDPTGRWRIRIYPVRGFGPYGFRIELRTPSEGGGGCPILLVWNGNYYVDYGVINIHNSEGYDVIKEISVLKEDLGIEGYIAKFKLREGWEGLNYSHSSIDQVKLYAVDKRGNRYLCPLVNAIHSEQGNIWPKILLSDDQKSDLYLSETIILEFIVPHPLKAIKSFIFVIEGCNLEKSPW